MDGSAICSKELSVQFEVLEKLEAKVQNAVDTIELLQMELDELKSSNDEMRSEREHLVSKNHELQEANEKLAAEHEAWQGRLRVLLGKIDEMEEATA